MMLNNFGGGSTVYNSHGQENSKDTSQTIESSKQSGPSLGPSSSWGYSSQLEGIYNSNLACYPGNHQGMYSVDQYKSNSKYSLQQEYGRFPQYSSNTIHHPIPVKCSEICCQHVPEPPRYPLNPSAPFQFSSHHVQPPPRYTDYPSNTSKQFVYNKREKPISCNSNFPQMHSEYQVAKYPHSMNMRQKEMKEPKTLIESHCPVYPMGNAYWMPPPPPYHQSVALQYKNNQVQENRVSKPLQQYPAFQNVEQNSQERKGVIMNGTSNSGTVNIKSAPDYQSHSFRTDCFELPSPFMTCSFSTGANRIPLNNNNSSSMHQSSVSSNFNSNNNNNSSSSNNVISNHCQIVDKQRAQVNSGYSHTQAHVPGRIIPNSNCRRMVSGSSNHLMTSNEQVFSDVRHLGGNRTTPDEGTLNCKGSECAQPDNTQKKRPHLDVRQFLATWEDDEEDSTRTSDMNNPSSISGTTAPVIVLDCRNIEEHEIRRVRDKLNSWENLQSEAAKSIAAKRDTVGKHIVEKSIINHVIAKPLIQNEASAHKMQSNRDDHMNNESMSSIMMCTNAKSAQNSFEPNFRNSKSSHLMVDNRFHNTFSETETDPHYPHHHVLRHITNQNSKQQFATSWDHSDIDKSAGSSNVLQHLESHQSTPIQPVYPHSIQHYEKKSNVSIVEPVPMIARNSSNFTLDPAELKEQSPLEHLVNFYGDPRRSDNSFDLMGIQDRYSDRLNNRLYSSKQMIHNSNPMDSEHLQNFDAPQGEMFCETTSILKLVDNGRANITDNSIKTSSIELTENGGVLESLKDHMNPNHGSYCQSIIANPQAVFTSKNEPSKMYTDLDTNKTLILNLAQRAEQNHCMPVIAGHCNLNNSDVAVNSSCTTPPLSKQSSQTQDGASSDGNMNIHNKLLTTISTEHPRESVVEIPPLCHDLQPSNEKKNESSCTLLDGQLSEIDQQKTYSRNDTTITLHSVGECHLNSSSHLAPTASLNACPPYDNQFPQFLNCTDVGKEENIDKEKSTSQKNCDNSNKVNIEVETCLSDKKSIMQTSPESINRLSFNNSNSNDKTLEKSHDDVGHIKSTINSEKSSVSQSNAICSDVTPDNASIETSDSVRKANLLHMPSLEDDDLVDESSFKEISVNDVECTKIESTTNIISKESDNASYERTSPLVDASDSNDVNIKFDFSKMTSDTNKTSCDKSVINRSQLSSNTELTNFEKCDKSTDQNCATNNKNFPMLDENSSIVQERVFSPSCQDELFTEELNQTSSSENSNIDACEKLLSRHEDNSFIVEEPVNKTSLPNKETSHHVQPKDLNSLNENKTSELLSLEMDKFQPNSNTDLKFDESPIVSHNSIISTGNVQQYPACTNSSTSIVCNMNENFLNNSTNLNLDNITSDGKLSRKENSNEDLVPNDLNSNRSIALPANERKNDQMSPISVFDSSTNLTYSLQRNEIDKEKLNVSNENIDSLHLKDNLEKSFPNSIGENNSNLNQGNSQIIESNAARKISNSVSNLRSIRKSVINNDRKNTSTNCDSAKESCTQENLLKRFSNSVDVMNKIVCPNGVIEKEMIHSFDSSATRGTEIEKSMDDVKMLDVSLIQHEKKDEKTIENSLENCQASIVQNLVRSTQDTDSSSLKSSCDSRLSDYEENIHQKRSSSVEIKVITCENSISNCKTENFSLNESTQCSVPLNFNSISVNDDDDSNSISDYCSSVDATDKVNFVELDSGISLTPLERFSDFKKDCVEENFCEKFVSSSNETSVYSEANETSNERRAVGNSDNNSFVGSEVEGNSDAQIFKCKDVVESCKKDINLNSKDEDKTPQLNDSVCKTNITNQVVDCSAPPSNTESPLGNCPSNSRNETYNVIGSDRENETETVLLNPESLSSGAKEVNSVAGEHLCSLETFNHCQSPISNVESEICESEYEKNEDRELRSKNIETETNDSQENGCQTYDSQHSKIQTCDKFMYEEIIDSSTTDYKAQQDLSRQKTVLMDCSTVLNNYANEIDLLASAALMTENDVFHISHRSSSPGDEIHSSLGKENNSNDELSTPLKSNEVMENSPDVKDSAISNMSSSVNLLSDSSLPFEKNMNKSHCTNSINEIDVKKSDSTEALEKDTSLETPTANSGSNSVEDLHVSGLEIRCISPSKIISLESEKFNTFEIETDHSDLETPNVSAQPFIDNEDTVIHTNVEKKQYTKSQIKRKSKLSSRLNQKLAAKNIYSMKKVCSLFRQMRYNNRFKNNLKANKRYKIRKDFQKSRNVNNLLSESVPKPKLMNKENYPSNSLCLEICSSNRTDDEISFPVHSSKDLTVISSIGTDDKISSPVTSPIHSSKDLNVISIKETNDDISSPVISPIHSSKDVNVISRDSSECDKIEELTSSSFEKSNFVNNLPISSTCALEIVCTTEEMQMNYVVSEDQLSASSCSSTTSCSSSSGMSSECSDCNPTENIHSEEITDNPVSNEPHHFPEAANSNGSKNGESSEAFILQEVPTQLKRLLKKVVHRKSIQKTKPNNMFHKNPFSMRNIIRNSKIYKQIKFFKENKLNFLKMKIRSIMKRKKLVRSSNNSLKTKSIIMKINMPKNIVSDCFISKSNIFECDDNDTNNNFNPDASDTVTISYSRSQSPNNVGNIINDVESPSVNGNFNHDPATSSIFDPDEEGNEQQRFPMTELIVTCDDDMKDYFTVEQSTSVERNIDCIALECENVEGELNSDKFYEDSASVSSISGISEKSSGKLDEENYSDSENCPNRSPIRQPTCNFNRMSFAGLNDTNTIAIIVEEMCNSENERHIIQNEDTEQYDLKEIDPHEEPENLSESISCSKFQGSSFLNNSLDELSVTEVELSYSGEPAKQEGGLICVDSPHCIETISNKVDNSPQSHFSEGYNSDEDSSSSSSSITSSITSKSEEESSGVVDSEHSLKVFNRQIDVVSISPLNQLSQTGLNSPSIRPEMKCSLPWERVFNTVKTRKRKSRRKIAKTNKNAIELGPANVEFSIASFKEKFPAWKVVRNSSPSPIIRVARLILQRDPELTSFSEDSTSPKSEDSSEEEFIHASKTRKLSDGRESYSSSEENLIPKVLIKKIEKSEQYKSFLKLPDVTPPVARRKAYPDTSPRQYESSCDSKPVENVVQLEEQCHSKEEHVNSSPTSPNNSYCDNDDDDDDDDDERNSIRSSSSVISRRSEVSTTNHTSAETKSTECDNEVIASNSSNSDSSDDSDCASEQGSRDSFHSESLSQTSAKKALKRPMDEGEESGAESVTKKSPKSISDHLFHCQRCLLIFNNKEEVMEHQATRHPSHRELHHCMLCWRSFPSQSEHSAHMQGRSHRRLELVQRCTIHAMHRFFTGSDCPRLFPLTPGELKSLNWRPSQPGCIHFYHHPSPLQLALQDNPWNSNSRLSEEASVASQSPASSPSRDSPPLTLSPSPMASPLRSSSLETPHYEQTSPPDNTNDVDFEAS